MKSSEIVVGGHYTAQVSGKVVTVRVEKIRKAEGFKGPLSGKRVRGETMYDVTNLTTGRSLTFRSCTRFRGPAKGPAPKQPAATQVGYHGEEADPCRPTLQPGEAAELCREEIAAAKSQTEEARERARNASLDRQLKIAAPDLRRAAQEEAAAKAQAEGEQSADPTDSDGPLSGGTMPSNLEGEQIADPTLPVDTGVGSQTNSPSSSGLKGLLKSRRLPTKSSIGPLGTLDAVSEMGRDKETSRPFPPSSRGTGKSRPRTYKPATAVAPSCPPTLAASIPPCSPAAAAAPPAGPSVPPKPNGLVSRLRSLGTPSAAPALSAASSEFGWCEGDAPDCCEGEAGEPCPGCGKLVRPMLPTTVAGMTPTTEQAAILTTAHEVEAARAVGARVMVIGAGAGTGKTATLKMLEQVLSGRGQYTAFNSSLVAESKAKFVRCRVNTPHSLAFGAVGRPFAHRLNGPRVRSDQIARTLGIVSLELKVPTLDPQPDGSKERVKHLSPGFLAGQVIVAIRRFCQTADRELTEAHFRYIDGIDAPEPGEAGKPGRHTYGNNTIARDYLLPFARAAWLDLSDPSGTLPFNHDVYVKLWQLGEGPDAPYIAADYILLDEAQDTSKVLLDILARQTHALLIMVGDDNQQIYEWRGAVNAMQAFPGAPRRLLSQSFRFGQVIADVANSVLRTLDEPTDLVMRGLPTIPSRVARLDKPRCVLCRTNAGAISTVMQAVAAGRRPHLIGKTDEIVAFVRAAAELQAGRPTQHPELCCFGSWAEVKEYSKSDEGDELRLMVKLIDDFTCDAILKALDNMPPEATADLVVSTAHKSKGREWDTVKLAGDFPVATKMTDADRRLLYVAATRAKEALDLSECPPFCGGVERNPSGETREVPGIEVTYTVPMPTEEVLAEYRASKAAQPTTPVSSQPALLLHGESRPTTPSRTANGNDNLPEYTWANVEGGWRVRGPKDQQGQRVTVTRKNGSTSTEQLKEVVKKLGDLWFYAV